MASKNRLADSPAPLAFGGATQAPGGPSGGVSTGTRRRHTPAAPGNGDDDRSTAGPPPAQPNGHERRTPGELLTTLERSDDMLDRTVAGYRAATLSKLLFTESETAIILGVSPEVLKLWRRLGKGPPYVRLGAKFVRYHYTGLERYVDALQLENAPSAGKTAHQWKAHATI